MFSGNRDYRSSVNESSLPPAFEGWNRDEDLQTLLWHIFRTCEGITIEEYKDLVARFNIDTNCLSSHIDTNLIMHNSMIRHRQNVKKSLEDYLEQQNNSKVSTL